MIVLHSSRHSRCFHGLASSVVAASSTLHCRTRPHPPVVRRPTVVANTACSSSFSSYAAALRRKAVKRFGAPPAVEAVLDDTELLMGRAKDPTTKERRYGAAVRQVGATRRVILADPHLTSREIEGLAYRIKVLTRNKALSSILITSTDDRVGESSDMESLFLPSLLLDRDSNFIMTEHVDPGFPPAPGCTYLVAAGYDPVKVNGSDAPGVADLMTHTSALAVAVRGSSHRTSIPTLTLPHGLVQNSGYAFLHASYVLATRETSFQVTTPSMGLSLDPVALSYALPRLGREFSQPCQKYPTGMLLGLAGYQANAEDCMETGLATHYVETATIVGDLEHAMSQLPPYEQQTLVKPPKRFHGQVGDQLDLNRSYRNVTLADTIHCYSDYAADGAELWVNEDLKLEDPSLEVDDLAWHEDRTSDLVDFAATYADILREPTMVGLYERLYEVATADQDGLDEEERLVANAAKEFCRRMAAASPLALTATHRLLQLGGRQSETWESCIDRERRVQTKLLQGADFRTWQATHRTGKQTKWTHSSLKDVTSDEVAELIEA